MRKLENSLFAASQMHGKLSQVRQDHCRKSESDDLQRKIMSQFSRTELQTFVGAPPIQDHTRHRRRSTRENSRRMSRAITVAYPAAWYVISEKSRPLKIFQVVLGMCVIYSCLTVVYFLAWPDSLSLGWTVVNWMVEGVFVIDIVLKFMTDRDPNTNEMVRHLPLIAKRYMTSWFLPDMLAVTPFYLVNNDLLWMKLIRLVRLFKFIEMLEVDKIEKPLEWVLAGVAVEKRMFITFVVKNVYKIFRLIIVALLLTYYVGCFWFMFSENYSTGEETFVDKYELDKYNAFHQMLICSYFALTTLSTVGYGDPVMVISYPFPMKKGFSQFSS